MQSREIRKAKRTIRRIKRINKENVHHLNWLKDKIKLLEKELASKKQCTPIFNKLIADGESKLRLLEQKVARLAKNGNKRRAQTKS